MHDEETARRKATVCIERKRTKVYSDAIDLPLVKDLVDPGYMRTLERLVK